MVSDSLSVDIIDSTGTLASDAVTFIRMNACKAGAILRARGELRVRVVDDAAMSEAHGRYLGDPTTTDVITFDYSDAAGRPGKPESLPTKSDSDRSLYAVDADILICVDEADRRARQGGYAVERELLLYVVHGLLHCLGWDDEDPAESSGMHRLEDAVLFAIGVGRVYQPEGQGDT
ncbi:MAG: rRNA maturation RNase YbeY [Planctomycetota bacterium]|nr:rRNA maturation RNase YbeY [Planctomycetota bacterium]